MPMPSRQEAGSRERGGRGGEREAQGFIPSLFLPSAGALAAGTVKLGSKGHVPHWNFNSALSPLIFFLNLTLQ